MIIESKGLAGFVAIVEHGNFERAAKNLNITTSALSIRISTLERNIGSKLLIRKRPFVLTDSGYALYSYALKLRELESILKERITKVSR